MDEDSLNAARRNCPRRFAERVRSMTRLLRGVPDDPTPTPNPLEHEEIDWRNRGAP